MEASVRRGRPYQHHMRRGHTEDCIPCHRLQQTCREDIRHQNYTARYIFMQLRLSILS